MLRSAARSHLSQCVTRAREERGAAFVVLRHVPANAWRLPTRVQSLTAEGYPPHCERTPTQERTVSAVQEPVVVEFSARTKEWALLIASAETGERLAECGSVECVELAPDLMAEVARDGGILGVFFTAPLSDTWCFADEGERVTLRLRDTEAVEAAPLSGLRVRRCARSGAIVGLDVLALCR